MFKGSCLCGQISFSITRFETAIAHCHCSMCRKFHGAAFSTLAEVKKENFHWVTGQEHLTTYLAANKSKRLFCQTCGASLAFISTYNEQDQTMEIAIGCLDELTDDLYVNAHIFTESKVPWYQINDTLPQYKKFRA